MQQKRLLLLGASYAQIPAILKAKEMGVYVIACDWNPENPGVKYADEYHNVSTTDKEAVLALAKTLKIDGIYCYTADSATPTVAYVAEKLGLPGSPYAAIETIEHKDRFRAFLAANGFKCPRARGYASIEEARADLPNFRLPVMVKPTDCGGSRGIAKLTDPAQLEGLVRNALAVSREKRFVIEEYIPAHGPQISGDAFFLDGSIRTWCWLDHHYSAISLNPNVPTAASAPMSRPHEVHLRIRDELQRLLRLLNAGNQAFDIDARLDAEGNVWFIEINPRNGGNMIQEVIRRATGHDMIAWSIRAALGEDCSALQQVEPTGFWAYYTIHTNQAGKFASVSYSEDIRDNVVVEAIAKQPGDPVRPFTGNDASVGNLTLSFASAEEMNEKLDHMERYLSVEVC